MTSSATITRRRAIVPLSDNRLDSNGGAISVKQLNSSAGTPAKLVKKNPTDMSSRSMMYCGDQQWPLQLGSMSLMLLGRMLQTYLKFLCLVFTE